MEKLVVFATAAQNRLPKTFKLKFCIASYTKCLYNKSVVVVCFIVFSVVSLQFYFFLLQLWICFQLVKLSVYVELNPCPKQGFSVRH